MNLDLDLVISKIDVFALTCTQDELARALEITRDGLYKRLKKAGINFREQRSRCLADKIRVMLVYMPATAIADRLRIDVRTVRKYAHQAGVRFGHGGRRVVRDGKWG